MRKKQFLTILVASLVLLAGCGAIPGVDNDGEDPEPVESFNQGAIPSNATSVMYLNSSLLEDPETKGVVDNVVSEFNESIDLDSQSEIENLSDFDSVTVFSKSNSDSVQEYSGAIVDSELSKSEVISVMNGSSVSVNKTTYNGNPVYEFANNRTSVVDEVPSEKTLLGFLGDGRFVVGTEQPVRDSIDAYEGDIDTISESVVSKLDNNAHITFVVESVEEFAGGEYKYNISSISGSYSTPESQIVATTQIGFELGTDAEKAHNQINSSLSLAKMQLPEEISKHVENVELDRNGPQLTVKYKSPADEFNTLVSSGIEYMASSQLTEDYEEQPPVPEEESEEENRVIFSPENSDTVSATLLSAQGTEKLQVNADNGEVSYNSGQSLTESGDEAKITGLSDGDVIKVVDEEGEIVNEYTFKKGY